MDGTSEYYLNAESDMVICRTVVDSLERVSLDCVEHASLTLRFD